MRVKVEIIKCKEEKKLTHCRKEMNDNLKKLQWTNTTSGRFGKAEVTKLGV